MKAATLSELRPPMKSPWVPRWPYATWAGILDLPVALADSIQVTGASGYRQARLLVRQQSRPVTFVHADIADDRIDGASLAPMVSQWNRDTDNSSAVGAEPTDLPSMTVVISTRNRTTSLRQALASVLACDYADFEVVVVDNASDDDSTVQYVKDLADRRVRVVAEPVPGLAVARNAGVLAARGDVVAFTDDDVVVDSMWLHWLGTAIKESPKIGCVTGLVPSGELRTPTQSYFEKQVHWSRSLKREIFDIALPPPYSSIFPFQVGLYGTGASFAMPRSVVLDLGGFDEALGVGSPTGGGEDIDMFVRVLSSGRQLIYEPAAIVWHRHRADMPALVAQARGYGLGLGAWLTKVACDRSLMPMAVRRVWRAVGQLRRVTEPPEVDGFSPPPKLRRTQITAIVGGPFAYIAARRQGRRATPLAE